MQNYMQKLLAMEKIRVLIAPNAFKGTMNSAKATACMVEGMEQYKQLQLRPFPVADGGDGTLEVLVENFKGEYKISEVADPLGRKISAKWGVINKDTAVIEMANASGIKLLKNHERDPMRANTFGTGQLMIKAIEDGCRKIILGIGGSATVDGGAGILKAFGAHFSDATRKSINFGNYLMNLEYLDTRKCRERLKDVEILVLSDVENPLLGNNGAARVFGPQKGAGEYEVEALEKAMKKFSKLVVADSKRDVTGMKGAGAAGGIAFALKSFFRAEVVGGFDFLLENTGLMAEVEACDILITGEGKIDSQTLKGKAPGKIAALAKSYGKLCVGICGVYEWHENMSNYFDLLLPVNPGKPVDEQLLERSPENLQRTASQLGCFIVGLCRRQAPGENL